MWWGIYNIGATLVTTYELGYATAEIDKQMASDFQKLSPEERHRHDDKWNNYRDRNEGEDAWVQALAV